MDTSAKRDLHQIRVIDRELAAILAGLRLLQEQDPPADLLDILTDGGKFAPLTAEEIDALCERLNTK